MHYDNKNDYIRHMIMERQKAEEQEKMNKLKQFFEKPFIRIPDDEFLIRYIQRRRNINKLGGKYNENSRNNR